MLTVGSEPTAGFHFWGDAMGDEFIIRNYYSSKVPIDDGIEGDAVREGTQLPIRIRRFTVAELQEFQRGFARLTAPTSQRFIYRKPDGDEQAMRTIPERKSADGMRVLEASREEHVIPDEEVERRRLEEMTSETRAAYEAASAADDAFMAAFCSEAIEKHIWLPPGVTLKVVAEDDRAEVVADGKGIVTAFGGNLSMLVRLTKAIHRENTLAPEAKKVLRSLSDLTASSPKPRDVAAVGGETPAAIATTAGAADFASSGDAPAVLDLSLSGSIAS